MVLDTSLLNTQQYKVRMKGKVEQSRERSTTLHLHLSVVAIEKGAFWSPSTTVANFTFTYLFMSDNWVHLFMSDNGIYIFMSDNEILFMSDNWVYLFMSDCCI